MEGALKNTGKTNVSGNIKFYFYLFDVKNYYFYEYMNYIIQTTK